MKKSTVALVRNRAAGRCEYCRAIESYSTLKFQIEHVVARQHGGHGFATNLALACRFCNSHKGPNLSGIDPISGRWVKLFHPRNDQWPEHFEWDGALIVGTTDVGRVTLAVLAMNHSIQVETRIALIEEGVFFPHH